MGRPANYSAELPLRCQALIEKYGALIAADDDHRFRGPLKTTFLLAMATPMLVLPFERIFLAPRGGRVADDAALDSALSQRVHAALGAGQAFADAPFVRAGAWRYVPRWPAFNVGGSWPTRALDALGSGAALAAAGEADAHRVLACLRNALAHGGVTYLDAEGRHTFDATHMLGFANWAGRGADAPLSLLRVSVADFETFLGDWTAWISAAGVGQAIDAEGPGFFSLAAE